MPCRLYEDPTLESKWHWPWPQAHELFSQIERWTFGVAAVIYVFGLFFRIKFSAATEQAT
jgi:hypothetical protein